MTISDYRGSYFCQSDDCLTRKAEKTTVSRSSLVSLPLKALDGVSSLLSISFLRNSSSITYLPHDQRHDDSTQGRAGSNQRGQHRISHAYSL